MKIIYLKGDILNSEDNLLIHQVNCQGVMGSGVAKVFRNRFPNLFNNYKYIVNTMEPTELFGSCFIHREMEGSHQVLPIVVANLFSQYGYGRTKQHTDYPAMRNSLSDLREWMTANNLWRASAPKIGCGLGGGEWYIVEGIIRDIFEDTPLELTIYEL